HEPKRAHEPVVAAAPPPQTVVARGEASGTDEMAQWWLAAWARWSGWKNTLGFPEATREGLSTHPDLLSFPIQQCAAFGQGVLDRSRARREAEPWLCRTRPRQPQVRPDEAGRHAAV